LQKRHIQPERYAQLCLKFLKYLKYILTILFQENKIDYRNNWRYKTAAKEEKINHKEQEMKKYIRVKIFAAGLGIAIMLTLAVCDNETVVDTCGCATGTIHKQGEACCDGVDCLCKQWQVHSFTANGNIVTIEDQTGLGTRFSEIQELITTLNGYVSKDIKIIVKPGSANDIEVVGHTFIAYNDWDIFTLGAKLQTAIISHNWTE
jgi:hypothetical protein